MIILSNLLQNNKAIITNLFAILIIIIALIFDFKYQNILLNIGFFAFSGAITNWLAIHMLFEKTPLLYGSGIIPNRFNEFKQGIKDLIIYEFFSKENIAKFMSQQNFIPDNKAIKKSIDFEVIFNNLLDAIANSSLGSMLAMFGGKSALEPIKEPVIAKLKISIDEILSEINNEHNHQIFSEKLYHEVMHIIDQRLAELTPKIVKDIIQKMIKKHLGWLVVWGGFFGGIIGFLCSILT